MYQDNSRCRSPAAARVSPWPTDRVRAFTRSGNATGRFQASPAPQS